MNEGSNTVISRLVAVWVWSVLTSVNIVVTFILAWYGVRSRGPFGLVMVGPAYLAAMIASFVGWLYVVRSLRTIIAPEFVPSSAGTAIHRMSIIVLIAVGLALLMTAVDFALSSILVG
jgi:hypothetical protein